MGFSHASATLSSKVNIPPSPASFCWVNVIGMLPPLHGGRVMTVVIRWVLPRAPPSLVPGPRSRAPGAAGCCQDQRNSGARLRAAVLSTPEPKLGSLSTEGALCLDSEWRRFPWTPRRHVFLGPRLPPAHVRRRNPKAAVTWPYPGS